jgi:hypothetical protein
MRRYFLASQADFSNVLRVLNTATPRPGDLFRLRVGKTPQDEIAIESRMPGAVDFEKGIVKVDYQLWPFFQAIDIDHILVCLEVSHRPMCSLIDRWPCPRLDGSFSLPDTPTCLV